MTDEESVELERFISDPSNKVEVAVQRLLEKLPMSRGEAIFRVRMSRGLIPQSPIPLKGKPFAERFPEAAAKARRAKREKLGALCLNWKTPSKRWSRPTSFSNAKLSISMTDATLHGLETAAKMRVFSTQFDFIADLAQRLKALSVQFNPISAEVLKLQAFSTSAKKPFEDLARKMQALLTPINMPFENLTCNLPTALTPLNTAVFYDLRRKAEFTVNTISALKEPQKFPLDRKASTSFKKVDWIQLGTVTQGVKQGEIVVQRDLDEIRGELYATIAESNDLALAA